MGPTPYRRGLVRGLLVGQSGACQLITKCCRNSGNKEFFLEPSSTIYHPFCLAPQIVSWLLLPGWFIGEAGRRAMLKKRRAKGGERKARKRRDG